MKQLSKSHSPLRKIRYLQSLLLALVSVIATPAFVSQQQSVQALETDGQQVASINTWRGASFPVENFRGYSSPFGYRRSATGGSNWEFHGGLDLAAPQGSYVRNWWAGRVVKVADRSACGTHIIIQSGQWEHKYCHMQGHVEIAGGSRYLVDREGGIQIQEGQLLGAGSRIGRVGMTGRTTGPHLHWGLKYASNYVDPALVLRAMYAQQPSNIQKASVSQQQLVNSNVSEF
jgi:murein DD-endopeptidase MepM/ murein hydrolase activator NlpD